MAQRLLERSRSWAGSLPGYTCFDLARPMAEQPVLLKESLIDRADDFQSSSWLPAAHAATGGTTASRCNWYGRCPRSPWSRR